MLAMGCFVWIPVAIWVVGLVNWMIQGEIDVVFGFIGIGIAVALGYTTLNPPNPAMAPLLAMAALVTIIAFPILRRSLNTKALVAIDVEKMEDAYEMLAMKPDNHITRFKLGKIMYEMGQFGPGMAIAAVALQSMPDRVFSDEHRMYARWKRLHPHLEGDQTVVCVDCGFANPPSAITCERCGTKHLIDVARGRWIGKDFAKKLIAGWGAGVAALVGIPLASQLPPVAAVVVILALMAGAILLLWNAFRAGRGVAPA